LGGKGGIFKKLGGKWKKKGTYKKGARTVFMSFAESGRVGISPETQKTKKKYSSVKARTGIKQVVHEAPGEGGGGGGEKKKKKKKDSL